MKRIRFSIFKNWHRFHNTSPTHSSIFKLLNLFLETPRILFLINVWYSSHITVLIVVRVGRIRLCVDSSSWYRMVGCSQRRNWARIWSQTIQLCFQMSVCTYPWFGVPSLSTHVSENEKNVTMFVFWNYFYKKHFKSFSSPRVNAVARNAPEHEVGESHEQQYELRGVVGPVVDAQRVLQKACRGNHHQRHRDRSRHVPGPAPSRSATTVVTACAHHVVKANELGQRCAQDVFVPVRRRPHAPVRRRPSALFLAAGRFRHHFRSAAYLNIVEKPDWRIWWTAGLTIASSG